MNKVLMLLTVCHSIINTVCGIFFKLKTIIKNDLFYF